MVTNRLARQALVAVVAGLALFATPALAQFSDGYRFLEAIKKKDGEKVLELLSEPGSTLINTRDVTNGQSGLHIVTQRRDLTWMTFLIQKGANINLRDQRGVTPLVLAANLGFIEGVELLVDNKAKVDEANDAGETPLISAVHNRNVALMRVLLKAGADPDRADNSGRSARDYALLAGNGSALLAEIEAGARPKEARKPAAPAYGPTL